MKLTAFGKFFLFLIIVGVVGFIAFKRYGDQLKGWAGADNNTQPQAVTKDDFENIKAINNEVKDPSSKGEVPLNSNAAKNVAVSGGKLERPLVVGINTW